MHTEREKVTLTFIAIYAIDLIFTSHHRAVQCHYEIYHSYRYPFRVHMQITSHLDTQIELPTTKW